MTTMKFSLTLAVYFASVSFACGQATVETAGRGSQLYSASADLVTGGRRIAGFGDDAVSLAQSFQSSTAISLQSFAILYEYDGDATAAEPNSEPVTIEIFEVADVQADTLVEGSSLLNVVLPVGSFPDNGAQGEALITLDTAIPLPAATGSEGYAIRITATGGFTRGFEWGRSTSATNNIFPGGRGYDNDGEPQFGSGAEPERDFSLALNPVPGRLGDYDADGDVDLIDLDDYNGEIGSPAVGTEQALDLNGNGVVDEDDFVQHYTTLVDTSNGQTGTLAGDVDLNGTVDVLGDAFALVGSLALVEGINSWSQGDLNADQTVNVLGDAFLLVGNLGNTNEP